jgi:excisionase family DNA binding protein
MTLIVAELVQALAETPAGEIPALIGILAELQAKAQLKMLSNQKVMKNGQDGLLTLRQVAARLNVPESRAYDLARQGKLPPVRIGKYVPVSAEALAEYQAKLPRV